MQRLISGKILDDAIRLYDNGNGPSIRELARKFRVSYTTMHTALTEANVTMRPAGSQRKSAS
ncbi:helix-turn-helix domain-containing protein [Saccharopolyspora hattusasensis]|uniref:helix-turn-helix domain-containing protein n=1 Tax=Saccharopolyspora hattusasensis TaxID=1128679 RepID=UPI003D98FCEE